MTDALNEAFDLDGTSYAVRVMVRDDVARSLIMRDAEVILDCEWEAGADDLPTDATDRQRWAQEYVLAFLLSKLPDGS